MIHFDAYIPYNGRRLYPLNSIMEVMSLAKNTSYYGNIVLHTHASLKDHPLEANGGPKIRHILH